jgi:hypothetical protein
MNQNDMKRINNYLIFLNQTNGQTCTKKSKVSTFKNGGSPTFFAGRVTR